MVYDTPESVAGLTEDELLLVAGEQLLPAGFAVDDRNAEQKEKDAREWFGQLLRRTRSGVCQHAGVQAFLGKEASYDRVLLIATVADVVAGATRGVSPFVAAALLLHYGLEKICMKPDD